MLNVTHRSRSILLALVLIFCTGFAPLPSSQTQAQINEGELPAVISITPASNAFAVSVDTSITLEFSRNVFLNDTSAYVMCDSGGEILVVASPDLSTLSTTFTLDPINDLPPGERCTLFLNVEGVQDEGGLPMLDSYTSSFFTAGCGAAYNKIHWLQQGGIVEPGSSLMVEGVVTAVTPGLGGYFLQELDPDTDPNTSEGIFIYGTPSAVSVGDHIRLFGKYQEYRSAATSYGQQYDQTEIVLEYGPELCDEAIVVPPALLTLPLTPETLEAHEGMLVAIPETLTVQQNFFQGRFGQLTLGSGGRIFNPNNGQGGTPSSVVQRMIILDDSSHQQNPNPISYYPVDGSVRTGDPILGVVGVLDQGKINATRSDIAAFTAAFPNVYYRIHPTQPVGFPPAGSPGRLFSAAPPDVGGSLKVVGFNVFNYFSTLDIKPYDAASPYDLTNTPRGADSTAEFVRQTDKIVSALAALNADVVGLTEIEAWQNPGGSAVDELVQALNAALGADTYAAVPDPIGFPYPQKLPAVGGDFIKVALIYKTTSVQPVGVSMMDNNAIYSRVPVAQTFKEIATNEVFSVVVNHLKSKSSCPSAAVDPVNIDLGQGCWNALRVQQASQLAAFVESIKTAASDPDVLVIGDLNAYGVEEPVNTLTTAGLTNLVSTFVPPNSQYSYIFDGQSGYLDHALATSTLTSKITDVDFWHINADEPSHIDYNTEFKPVDLYENHAFRSSDHDPLIIGLELLPPQSSLTTDDLPALFSTNQQIAFNLKVYIPDLPTDLLFGFINYRITNLDVQDLVSFDISPLGLGPMPLSKNQDGVDVIGQLPIPLLITGEYEDTLPLSFNFNATGDHTITFELELQEILGPPPAVIAQYSQDFTVQAQLFLPMMVK